MGVYKEGKNWKVQVYYKDWQGNRKRKQKRGFRTKGEAKEWERDFLQQQSQGVDIEFGNFLEIYYKDMDVRLRENTMYTKRYIIDLKIKPYFEKKILSEITVADVRAWQNELLTYKDKNGKGYSPTYLKTVNCQLTAIFNYAMRYYNLQDNPCRKAGAIGKSKGEPKDFWMQEEFNAFLETVSDKPETRMAFLLLYWTGMRIGELLALTYNDINLEEKTISSNKSYQRLKGKDMITQPKTPKSIRVITMPDFLAEKLMYPEKMTTEQLAEAMDEIAEAFDPYEYRDNVEMGENTVQEVMLDLQSGNIHYYVSYLKDIVDEECDLSVRAGVLMERLKAYEPELPKDMEPMVYVNYCEKSELGNPRCQKLSDLDSKTVEQDKARYADRDPNTNEPKTTAQMFFTVYYAEKGDKMLHHFQGKIEIGTGNGGIISQLKMQNEMKLTDESWISYQQGKGNEEYQKYMEDLTDMQNHVLPYLQSFCSLEEKGVQERREQKIAEKNESRETVPRTGVEANTAVKDAGKAERKTVEQKKAMARKEKKPSIHERLEINKRIIQEKQGKDKPARGADLSVRTV